MKLFSKEKGIILSILNAILIIWLMVGIILTVANVTNIVIKEHTYSYEEYKAVHCYYYEEYDDEEEYVVNDNYVDRTCKSEYTSYKLDRKDIENSRKRGLIVSITNIVLTTLALVILNIKGKDKK